MQNRLCRLVHDSSPSAGDALSMEAWPVLRDLNFVLAVAITVSISPQMPPCMYKDIARRAAPSRIIQRGQMGDKNSPKSTTNDAPNSEPNIDAAPPMIAMIKI